MGDWTTDFLSSALQTKTRSCDLSLRKYRWHQKLNDKRAFSAQFAPEISPFCRRQCHAIFLSRGRHSVFGGERSSFSIQNSKIDLASSSLFAIFLPSSYARLVRMRERARFPDLTFLGEWSGGNCWFISKSCQVSLSLFAIPLPILVSCKKISPKSEICGNKWPRYQDWRLSTDLKRLWDTNRKFRPYNLPKCLSAISFYTTQKMKFAEMISHLV